MTKFETIASPAIVLLRDNIDTDQIIPARFLKVTDRGGLGRSLFADWRTDAGFPLNVPFETAPRILVTGHNFGCGSSREHAVWALMDFGFRAVISTGFADIFRQNALKNGLLPIVLTPADHSNVLTAIEAAPSLICTVDLSGQTLWAGPNSPFSFAIDSFSKKCLLEGIDELGYLLSYADAISSYENLDVAERFGLHKS
jgi:3-isopropylmalate/(R)-2-methylmalate dehydratase small subunit